MQSPAHHLPSSCPHRLPMYECNLQVNEAQLHWSGPGLGPPPALPAPTGYMRQPLLPTCASAPMSQAPLPPGRTTFRSGDIWHPCLHFGWLLWHGLLSRCIEKKHAADSDDMLVVTLPSDLAVKWKRCEEAAAVSMNGDHITCILRVIIAINTIAVVSHSQCKMHTNARFPILMKCFADLKGNR